MFCHLQRSIIAFFVHEDLLFVCRVAFFSKDNLYIFSHNWSKAVPKLPFANNTGLVLEAFQNLIPVGSYCCWSCFVSVIGIFMGYLSFSFFFLSFFLSFFLALKLNKAKQSNYVVHWRWKWTMTASLLLNYLGMCVTVYSLMENTVLVYTVNWKLRLFCQNHWYVLSYQILNSGSMVVFIRQ